MLVANMPVSSRPITITMTPRPGIRFNDSRLSRAAFGNTACDALRIHSNTPSSRPSTEVSTQIVTASGSQTRRPAMRYFFTCVFR